MAEELLKGRPADRHRHRRRRRPPLPLQMSGLDVIVDSLQDVTILAPTNKSWLNLLATLGVSLTELKGGGILHAVGSWG